MTEWAVILGAIAAAAYTLFIGIRARKSGRDSRADVDRINKGIEAAKRARDSRDSPEEIVRKNDGDWS